jgi:hypothetical protein
MRREWRGWVDGMPRLGGGSVEERFEDMWRDAVVMWRLG